MLCVPCGAVPWQCHTTCPVFLLLLSPLASLDPPVSWRITPTHTKTEHHSHAKQLLDVNTDVAQCKSSPLLCAGKYNYSTPNSYEYLSG